MPQLHTFLNALEPHLKNLLQDLEQNHIGQRIADRDHTVWKENPTEISNRLGWLDSPHNMVDQLDTINAVVQAVRQAGYTHSLLLGMGGSSLAPEVFRRTFGMAQGYLDLSVLDSTHPDAVLACAKRFDPATTLYIPATKSGGTVETLSFLKYFYNQTVAALGKTEAGRHFVAITDPASGLAQLATELDFRHTFLNDPNIGGRYSALSLFGLVPAALMGVDIDRLLHEVRDTAAAGKNGGTGLPLGAAIGSAALQNRNKLTLINSPALYYSGAWVEQLIAESSGKEGRGILPVDGETLEAPATYGNDRLFVYTRLANDPAHDRAVQDLIDADLPVVRLDLDNLYELGALFYVWEMATIIAGHSIGINPFDQPNVEAAKVLARQMVDTYQQVGQLPLPQPTLEENGLTIFSQSAATSLRQALDDFLAAALPASSSPTELGYIALQAYTQSSAAIEAALQALRQTLKDRTQLATSIGYGPRFLHSTGQLHKGDAGKGLFLQFTDDPVADTPIPDAPGSPTSTMSFGVLIAAQALGDGQALLDASRTVLRIHLGQNPQAGLDQVRQTLASS